MSEDEASRILGIMAANVVLQDAMMALHRETQPFLAWLWDLFTGNKKSAAFWKLSRASKYLSAQIEVLLFLQNG